jgi:hypothetical protein
MIEGVNMRDTTTWSRILARWGIASLATVLAFATLTLVGAPSATAASTPPAYYPSGPQTDVPAATVTGGGWTPCYTDTYAGDLHTALPGLLTACTGKYLLLAGRATGSDTLSLLAAAPRSDVLFDTGGSSSATHTANGSEWYFHDSQAWGFANQGDSVDLSACDILAGPLRLCWHLLPGIGGFRIGDTTGLNSSADYERVVYQSGVQTITFTSTAPTGAVPGDTYGVTATGGASGNPVTFSIDAGSSTVCSISGSTVSFTHPGDCVIDADQAGNTDYLAGHATQTITVSKIAQSVAFTSTAPGSAVPGLTYDVAATGGASGNPVTFSIDAGSSGLCSISGSTVSFTHPGDCVIDADQAGTTDYAAATQAQQRVTVAQAATTSSVAVEPGQIIAHVTVQAPGVGTPTGTVDFTVGTAAVGSGALVDGTATLAYRVPAGAARTVAVRYRGDTDFAPSSASTARRDPSITAQVTSARPRHHGWYGAPVTVTFQCAANGAALATACPGPVTLRANAAGQSATGTVSAVDGGVATVSVTGIDIDTVKPAVRIAGAKQGATYLGTLPTPRCVAKDRLSGVASCRLTRHAVGSRVRWKAVATDRAGNKGTVAIRATVLPVDIQGAHRSGGAFAVRSGSTYTLVVTGTAHRPVYYDAALAPHRPVQRDKAFLPAGHHRWALGVSMTPGMRVGSHWNLGVKIGKKMVIVKVRVRA